MNQTSSMTPAAKKRYWTRIIVQARAYSDSVVAFCREKNISINNYYYWFRRLRVNHPEWSNLAKAGREKGANPHSEPETEVVERPVRRNFTAAYKAKIMREVDEAKPGAVAAILRKEGLYSSHLQKWRREESRREHEARKRGPKTNPLAAEVRRLREENARLEKRLTKAGHIIDLQKKIAEIMEVTLEEIPDEE